MRKKKIENIYVKNINYCNLYIIRGKNGDILIDTGFVGRKKYLKRWLDKYNIKLIILTHAHLDHAWNAAYIKKLYNCEIALGINDVYNIDNSKIHSVPSKDKYYLWTKLMNYFMRKLVPAWFDVDILLKNNQIIRRYGIELKIVDLPGHTNGSIGIIYKDYLFAGDALVNRRKRVQIAFQNQNNEEALNTYQKILGISPKIVFLGHDRYVTLEELRESYNRA